MWLNWHKNRMVLICGDLNKHNSTTTLLKHPGSACSLSTFFNLCGHLNSFKIMSSTARFTFISKIQNEYHGLQLLAYLLLRTWATCAAQYFSSRTIPYLLSVRVRTALHPKSTKPTKPTMWTQLCQQQLCPACINQGECNYIVRKTWDIYYLE